MKFMERSVFALLTSAAVALTITPAVAQSWAERLGYPPGKRVLILDANELGISFEANEAGRQGFAGGLLKSASVMVPGPWFDEFAEWSRRHDDYDVGICLTMFSEWPYYRWRPVAERSVIPNLVDSEGFLAGSILQFSINATPDEVEREIESQIQRARAAGIRPSHLSSYLGALVMRPELTRIYLQTARKYWIPAVLIEVTPDHVRRFREMGFPLEDEMISLIRDYPLPKLDDLHFIPRADSYEKKREEFFALVQNLPPGITQINLQPAIESQALKRLSDDWQQRVWDAQLLTDPAVKQFLRKQQIAVTSWRDLMHRFEGRRPEIEEGEEPLQADDVTKE